MKMLTPNIESEMLRRTRRREFRFVDWYFENEDSIWTTTLFVGVGVYLVVRYFFMGGL